ncbi:uncharacterized protein LOC110729418 [Chenopodium quinoa]|uniref:uncharacterized protein LOC110729418 n=1 Tax=Chenopodium quinoa TaxID=63459 RepID=UPI000B78ABFA|nr:uncharacterized protein LOC110729418 [Chenopodium quinoa]
MSIANTIMNKTLPDLSKLEPIDDYVLNEDVIETLKNAEEAAKTSTTAIPAATTEALKKKEKDNKLVRGHLLNHMNNTLFDLFVNFRSSKVIWDSLEKKYGADDAGKKKYVVGKWINFKVDDEKPIMTQVHDYENMVTEILGEGMKMCETLQANVLLEKFPPSWNDYTNLVESSLNVSKNRKNSKKKGNNKSKSNFTHNNKIQKPKRACYVCGIIGHKAYQCNRRHEAKKDGTTFQANIVEKEDIIAAVVVEANLVKNKIEWILDTGASRHFCANKALMTEFEDVTNGDHGYMGNSSTAGVLGKGKVHLKLTSTKTLFLNNVLYVPFLRRNLVSGALLNKAGLKFVFEADKIVMTKNGDFVGKGYLNNGLFVLNVMNENGSTSFAYIV